VIFVGHKPSPFGTIPAKNEKAVFHRGSGLGKALFEPTEFSPFFSDWL
jgi:hypothetical protein